jgi:hypothetical protein
MAGEQASAAGREIAEGDEMSTEIDELRGDCAYRFEYADGSAFEIFIDGRAFIVQKDGRREEKMGKITNRIPSLIRAAAALGAARMADTE